MTVKITMLGLSSSQAQLGDGFYGKNKMAKINNFDVILLQICHLTSTWLR